MYNLGTPAQECEILVTSNVLDLQILINRRLSEDWRLYGEMKIEQTNSSYSSLNVSQLTGTFGHTPISVSANVPSTTMSSLFRYIQVMIR